jgi:hypothetical protein
MHQLKAAPQGLGMDGVDVGDLDGGLRDDRCRRILAQDAELGGRVGGGPKGQDPAQVHGDLEAEQAGVEVAGGIRLVGGDIGHNPS